jgi:CRP/FNR family transcriptional regulator, cyclic AMP receptor protein
MPLPGRRRNQAKRPGGVSDPQPLFLLYFNGKTSYLSGNSFRSIPSGGVIVRCPKCQAELADAQKYCGECGHNVKPAAEPPSPGSNPGVSAHEEAAGGEGEEALKLPSGFSRTLSTDLVARQIEARMSAKLSALVQSRTYKPAEVLIRQGETSRDLFFLTEGVVEISRKGGDEDLVLNEIESPYILGDVAFLFGMPRTATATAKTEVKAFVLKHEDLKDILNDLPPWVHPLLTSLASDIKSLHHKSQTLEKRLSEAEQQGKQRS